MKSIPGAQGLDAFELPRTTILKTAKSSPDLPESVQLRKDLQSALVKSASVFISYLTAMAHDNATRKGGKTIAAQHVLEAVGEIEELAGEEEKKWLKEELRAYRENLAQKKAASKESAGKKKADGAEGEGAREDEEGDADVSRFTTRDDEEEGEEADESTRLGEDGGDESILRKSLHNGSSAHKGGDDEDEEEEEEDEGRISSWMKTRLGFHFAPLLYTIDTTNAYNISHRLTIAQRKMQFHLNTTEHGSIRSF